MSNNAFHWDKVLVSGEKIEKEFTVGDRYIKIWLIIWGVISIFFLVAGGIGIIIFLIALFYFTFYLKKANQFAFTNKRLIIKRGWLSTKTICIDYSKITDTMVVENFFDRIIFRTGTIAVNTAGTSSHEVLLSKIENAYEAKKELDQIINHNDKI